MKSEDMEAILDFLYLGEANIHQENLDFFLNIAEELNINGLTRGKTKDLGDSKELQDKTTPYKDYFENKTNIATYSSGSSDVSHSYPISETSTPKLEISENLTYLDEKIASMICCSESRISNGKKVKKVYGCKVCGKEGMSTQVKQHIEMHHLEGISIP